MEALVELLIVFVSCGLVLIVLALIMYGAQLLDEKIDNWLTDRKYVRNLVISGTSKIPSECPRMTSEAFFTLGNIFYCL